MSKRKKILDLLKDQELTTKEIQEKTNYDINLIWTYISQYKKEEKIKQVGTKDKFPIYKAINEVSNGNLQTYKDIIKKFIPKFIEKGINIDFSEKEFEIVKQLYEEVK